MGFIFGIVKDVFGGYLTNKSGCLLEIIFSIRLLKKDRHYLLKKF